MLTADVPAQVTRLLPDGDVTVWLVGAGVLALYLAYRAARFAGRLVSLGVAAALFLGAGPGGLGPAGRILPWGDEGTSDAGQTDVTEPEVAPPPGAFRGVVTHVGDGDSLRARVTAAGDTHVRRDQELELRLLRIDAPELARDGRPAECLADEAAAALARLVPAGTEIRGAYDREHRDRYDRDLVHLWTPDGRWVNGEMLAAGLARGVTVPPNDGYEADVRTREAAARSARRGLWDPAVCPDPSP